jgi:4-amino-4-deoxy-L-arabinose transferase-like glycosyltransferase
MASEPSPRWISVALLLASLLIGLAHVAGLPPFEGFDETAHYSYIGQIAKTGTAPRFGDKIRKDAQNVGDAYPKRGRDQTLRFRNLFAADAEIIERMRRIVKTPRNPPPIGEPGDWANWEAQHPPLYYALLTPAYLLSERWSLVGQLALLRGLSYIAAWLSLCLAVFVAAKMFSRSRTGPAMIIAPALWPFVFPGWFPEMARLGNDSLIALLVACAVAVVALAPIKRWSTWFLLGVICGLGTLTKGTFLPFLAAITMLLLYRTWRQDARPSQFLGFVVTVLAVAGWWHVQRALETGMLFPMDDALALKETGGLIAGLTKHFSIEALARVIPTAGLGFLWSGTWSRFMPPLATLVPLVAMLLLIGCTYLYGLRSHRMRMHPLVQITVLTLGFWALAISYPTLVFMARGWGSYYGYYLHSLAPALAPIIGIAILAVAPHPLARTASGLLLAYSVVFLFGATFMQFLYFAGCGSNGSTRFDFASAGTCWNDWQRLAFNLDVLAYPQAALWLAAGGAVALGWGALTSLVLQTDTQKVAP